MDKDGDTIEIFKKVPLKKMYVKSADQNFINSEKMRIKEERILKSKELDV